MPENGYREYTAKGGEDDRIHLVDARPDVLLDPSPYRARCGQPLLEAYNTPEPVTCPECAGR